MSQVGPGYYTVAQTSLELITVFLSQSPKYYDMGSEPLCSVNCFIGELLHTQSFTNLFQSNFNSNLKRLIISQMEKLSFRSGIPH